MRAGDPTEASQWKGKATAVVGWCFKVPTGGQNSQVQTADHSGFLAKPSPQIPMRVILLERVG